MTTLRPIDSFRQYFLDVKPYHTKILEVVEKYNFQEDLPVNIEESIFFNIEYKNDPLCKTVGYGFVWDEECGFDAVDCCDLFDCIGGYGLIFDNSDLVVSIPINTVNSDVDSVVVPGNHVYDVKNQIDSIPAYDTIIVNGDLTPYFAYHKLFVILPVRTLYVVENTAGEIKIKGNYAAELVNERLFKLYNTSEDDGLYNVIQASYDSIFDLTTIVLADSQQVTPDLSSGIIEYNVGSKNNGAYLVDSHSFDGTSTTITLNSTTNVSFTNTTEGRNHGSIQLRTGLSPGRYIDLDVGNDSNGVYKILQSSYSGNSNETTVYVASDILHDAVGGWIRMYGYVNEGGFDGDGECSTPKHSNIKVGISERLVIVVDRPPEPPPTPLILYNTNVQEDINVLRFPAVDDFGAPLVYDATIDWGDGTVDALNAPGDYEHTYAPEVPTYPYPNVTITGVCPGYISHPRHTSGDIRVVITQWGGQKWKMLRDAFRGVNNAFVYAHDAPDLSECTSVQEMFRNSGQGAADTGEDGINNWDFTSPYITDLEYFAADSGSFGGDISGWNLGNVTSTAHMFENCDLWYEGSWTTTPYMFNVTNKVTNMEYMFYNNYSFGSFALNSWDVSNVTNMSHMFDMCKRYFHCPGAITDPDLSAWDTSKVTDMSYMFKEVWYWVGLGLGSFDTSSVTNMEYMFQHAWYIGDQYDVGGATVDVDTWDVSNVTNMSHMFEHGGWNWIRAGMSTWNVSNVTSFDYLLSESWGFNADLSGWTLTSATGSMARMFGECYNWTLPVFTLPSTITNTSGMFQECQLFNEDITGWPMQNVTDMSYMFDNAELFNQAIGVWDTSSVENMSHMFYQADAFNQPLDNWITSSVTDMSRMFYHTALFNQDLNSWDVSNVTDFWSMFQSNIVFNGNISSWVTSSALDMSKMFEFCDAFNSDISGWQTGTVVNMESMFERTDTFNADIGGWDVSSVENFNRMLSYAIAFNHDLSTWNVSSATVMFYMFYQSPLFTGDGLGNWTPTNLGTYTGSDTGASNMLTGTGITQVNYDAILTGWSGLTFANEGADLGSVPSNYSVGVQAARDILTSAPNNWVISDQGPV